MYCMTGQATASFALACTAGPGSDWRLDNTALPYTPGLYLVSYQMVPLPWGHGEDCITIYHIHVLETSHDDTMSA